MQHNNSLIKVIGPGLLFAGSAVGVSHLVQSTRAGAMYGMALVIFIIAAFFTKYPGFLFAPRYSAITGRSVLASYARQGRFAMGFYGLSTIISMFIGAAANLLVTSGLLMAVFGVENGVVPLATVISAAGMVMLVAGHYHWLDRIMRVLMAFLTIATLAATVMALPMLNWQVSGVWYPAEYDLATILFLAALVGWMPTPSDVSVWQSQWTVAKIRDTGYRPQAREANLDFHLGYISTLILAFCFVVLGAAVMHGSGNGFEGSPAKFAAQVIGLYEQALGKWSGSLVGIAAVSVMFSTLLAILDGYPRGFANFLLLLHGQEEGIKEDAVSEKRRHHYYWSTILIMVMGALLILGLFQGQFKSFVDFGATAAFLGAPLFALLNHRAMQGGDVPEHLKPGRLLYMWSIFGILALAMFAILYIYFAFLH